MLFIRIGSGKVSNDSTEKTGIETIVCQFIRIMIPGRRSKTNQNCPPHDFFHMPREAA